MHFFSKIAIRGIEFLVFPSEYAGGIAKKRFLTTYFHANKSAVEHAVDFSSQNITLPTIPDHATARSQLQS